MGAVVGLAERRALVVLAGAEAAFLDALAQLYERSVREMSPDMAAVEQALVAYQAAISRCDVLTVAYVLDELAAEALADLGPPPAEGGADDASGPRFA